MPDSRFRSSNADGNFASTSCTSPNAPFLLMMGNRVWAAVLILTGGLGWHRGQPTPSIGPSIESSTLHASLLLGRTSTGNAAASVLKAPLSTVDARLKAAIERSATGASFEIQLLIAQWFQHDRIALREWALKHASYSVKNAIIRHWLREAPKTTWIIERHSSKDRWNQLADRVLATDFPVRFFATASDERFRDPKFRDLIPTAIQHLAPDDFARAESIVAALEDKDTRVQSTIALSKAKLKLSNFEDAFAWASNLEHFPDSALATVIDSLAATDLDKALVLLEANITTDVPYQALRNTSAAMGELTFEEGIDRRNTHNLPFNLPVNWPDLPSDPLEAATMLESAGYERAPSYWSPDTGKAALDTMASQATSPLHNALIEQMLVSLHQKQPDAALEWIHDRPSAEERSRLAAHLVGSGSARDHLPSLMNLIDHDQIRNSDESLHYRVLGRATGAGQTMAAQDPKAAIQLIEQFEAPEARSAGFRSVSNIWFRHDEQATIDWLRSLTPEDREAAVKYSSSMREALAR